MILLILSLQGVFVIRWEITTPASIDLIIDKCIENNLDAVVVQVYARGEALVKNPYFPLFEELRTDKDLLKILIEKAGAYNIQVWAWVNLFYAWSQTDFPYGKGHITETHPEWFVVDKRGRKNIEMSVEELKRRGLEGYFVSPFVDEYVRKVRDYMVFIQNNYHVHGFILDYVRYPGRYYSYEPYVYEYIKRNLYIDRNDPLLPFLGVDFKRLEKDIKIKRITQVLMNLKQHIYLPVLACVYQNPERARSEFYQDWPQWIKMGVVDGVVPMIYTRDVKLFEKRITALKSYPIVPAIGVYLFKNSKGWKEEIRILRKYNINSFLLFSLTSL